MNPDPHREVNVHYKTVLIGSSLEALAVAYKYGIPVFGSNARKPLAHYYLDANLDLSFFGVENEIHEFRYLSGNVNKRGMQRIKLWNILCYRLSAMGLMPFWGNFDEDKIKGSMDKGKPLDQDSWGIGSKKFRISHENKIVNVSYDKVIIFDFAKYDDGSRLYCVNDYIDINTRHDFPENLHMSKDCNFTNTLAYETIFYDRGNRMHGCCVKSLIAEEYLDDWNYSATRVRMITERDIFWNIDKDLKIQLREREKAPVLYKMCDSLEEIINLDIMDSEVYD